MVARGISTSVTQVGEPWLCHLDLPVAVLKVPHSVWHGQLHRRTDDNDNGHDRRLHIRCAAQRRDVDARVQLAGAHNTRATQGGRERIGELADGKPGGAGITGCRRRRHGLWGSCTTARDCALLQPSRSCRQSAGVLAHRLVLVGPPALIGSLQGWRSRRTVRTINHAPNPASDMATCGFFTKFTRPALRSSAILRGLARVASESTVNANCSRA